MEQYESPDLKIIMLEMSDVVVTSDPTEGGIYGDEDDTDWS